MREKRLLERITSLQVETDRTHLTQAQVLTQSIVQHLQRILNTRRGSVPIDAEFGVPDFTNLAGSFATGETTQIIENMTRMIARYEPRLKSPRILVAEDNLVNQRVAVRMLERRGHQVLVAGNGREALETLDREHFDVILMDVQMPLLDGLETTRRIREREQGTGRHIPIIAMTAHAMKGDREQCLAAGMDDYLAKPINTAELYTVIEKHSPAEGNETGATASPQEHPKAMPDKKVFDFSEVLERVGNDREFLVEIAQLLLNGWPDHQARIRSAVGARDAPALQCAAHALKGALGNFGTGSTFAAAHRLEQLGRDGELGEAAGALRALEMEFERLRTALQAALPELRDGNPDCRR